MDTRRTFETSNLRSNDAQSSDTGQRLPSPVERFRQEEARREAARQEASLIKQLSHDFLTNQCGEEAIQRFGERFLQLTQLRIDGREKFPDITPNQCLRIRKYIDNSSTYTGDIKALAIMHAVRQKIKLETSWRPFPNAPAQGITGHASEGGLSQTRDNNSEERDRQQDRSPSPTFPLHPMRASTRETASNENVAGPSQPRDHGGTVQNDRPAEATGWTLIENGNGIQFAHKDRLSQGDQNLPGIHFFHKKSGVMIYIPKDIYIHLRRTSSRFQRDIKDIMNRQVPSSINAD
jgi:hypothetical protein